jgi:hypothetical protein
MLDIDIIFLEIYLKCKKCFLNGSLYHRLDLEFLFLEVLTVRTSRAATPTFCRRVMEVFIDIEGNVEALEWFVWLWCGGHCDDTLCFDLEAGRS